MYHFALLYPNEKNLLRQLLGLCLFNIQTTQQITDPFSKTTYLKDPEMTLNYTLEPYTELNISLNNEHKVRYSNGKITDGRDHLDLQELFSHLSKEDKNRYSYKRYGNGVYSLMQVITFLICKKFYTEVIGCTEGLLLCHIFKLSDVGLVKKKTISHCF